MESSPDVIIYPNYAIMYYTTYAFSMVNIIAILKNLWIDFGTSAQTIDQSFGAYA